MKIYIVENGNCIDGYYRDIDNARQAVRIMDDLIEEYKDHPNVDKKTYFITETETED